MKMVMIFIFLCFLFMSIIKRNDMNFYFRNGRNKVTITNIKFKKFDTISNILFYLVVILLISLDYLNFHNLYIVFIIFIPIKLTIRKYGISKGYVV